MARRPLCRYSRRTLLVVTSQPQQTISTFNRTSPMTVTQLVSTYRRAWQERPPVFGVPGGDLSPEETAGALVQEHGLDVARELAKSRADHFPASWSYEVRVWQVLCEAHEV